MLHSFYRSGISVDRLEPYWADGYMNPTDTSLFSPYQQPCGQFA